MSIQESGEMYLETILLLSKKHRFVRAVDVGEYMGYSKPSVSRAIGLLKREGYVTADNEGHLELTELGTETAAKIYERHELLTALLMRMGVGEDAASRDACRIEHCISDETFRAIKAYAEKTEREI